jgi:hypothetical protein
MVINKDTQLRKLQIQDISSEYMQPLYKMSFSTRRNSSMNKYTKSPSQTNINNKYRFTKASFLETTTPLILPKI